jgi:hypothetical protein
MSEVLVKFDEPIMNPRGEMFFAEAVGRLREDDGLWEGWIQFEGIDDSSKHIASERETTQPKRRDLEYWAQGLTFVYLQGALERAESAARSAADGQQERTH